MGMEIHKAPIKYTREVVALSLQIKCYSVMRDYRVVTTSNQATPECRMGDRLHSKRAGLIVHVINSSLTALGVPDRSIDARLTSSSRKNPW